jgi:uncharacterized protein DUF4058
MPSPFPGMDPYLENPILFPDLHDGMITYLREALQGHLPEPYYAGIGSQTWVEVAERTIDPDVNVLRSNGPGPGGQLAPEGAGAAVALKTRSEPIVIHVAHDPKKRTYVEVFHPRDGGRLVTTIEILSPTNKTPGEHGRDLYLRKQAEVLASKTHLIEIDLLRAGQHTTAVPHVRLLRGAGAFDYHVCVHRFDNFEDYFVYPWRLADRLPEIAVPLLPGDGDVPLDLQAVCDRCYEAANYRRRVRYSEETVPSLTAEQATWATELLAGQGLRPPAAPQV